MAVVLQSREASVEEAEKTGLIHRIYDPRGARDGEPRPVVFLVHGRAGNASVMWYFSKAFSGGSGGGVAPIVISPQAPEPDPAGGFSWWKTVTPPNAPDARSTEEKFQDAVRVGELLERFIERALEHYEITPSCIVAAGFSQGSGVISTLSLIRPGYFRGVAILSGFIPKAVMDSEQKLPAATGESLGSRRATSYFIAHGTLDPVIPVSRAEETARWLSDRRLEIEFHTEEVVHKVGTQGLRALIAWFPRIAFE